jgi:hypothetical protein
MHGRAKFVRRQVTLPGLGQVVGVATGVDVGVQSMGHRFCRRPHVIMVELRTGCGARPYGPVLKCAPSGPVLKCTFRPLSFV